MYLSSTSLIIAFLFILVVELLAITLILKKNVGYVDKILFEDDDIECFLVGNPRANGHCAISTKKHYKDMMDIDDETCKKVYVLAKRVMIILREVYKSEKSCKNHWHKK